MIILCKSFPEQISTYFRAQTPDSLYYMNKEEAAKCDLKIIKLMQSYILWSTSQSQSYLLHLYGILL